MNSGTAQSSSAIQRQASQTTAESYDSAAKGSSDKGPDSQTSSRGKGKKSSKRGGKPSGSSGTSAGPSSDPSGNGHGQTFKEGENVLLASGLSVSGRTERIDTTIKSEKFFHLIDLAWQLFVESKPSIVDRFSLAEFRHVSALMLYGRIQQVRKDAVGVTPSANVRIPLPKDLRVYQPIWSILSDIGVIEDDELRVRHVPDGQLPKTKDLHDQSDVIGLISCVLYDWPKSWDDVRIARENRPSYEKRFGIIDTPTTGETPEDEKALTALIVTLRTERAQSAAASTNPEYTVVNGKLQKKLFKTENGNFLLDSRGQYVPCEPTDYDASEGLRSVADVDKELAGLYDRASKLKKEKTSYHYTLTRRTHVYEMEDDVVVADPGAYGAWLHWDPQLWLEYDQLVEILSGIYLFSLSMPHEVKGTYMWVLPVEAREDLPNSVFSRMPKASIPPATWIKSLIMQMSTIAKKSRSTWYCETDTLSDVYGLMTKYLRAGRKRPSPVSQYGSF